MRSRTVKAAVTVLLTIVVALGCGRGSRDARSAPTNTARPPTLTPLPTNTLLPTETPPSTYTVWLTGIDCYEGSGAYGELVVPEINIWKARGPGFSRILGHLPHGAQVDVLERVYVDEQSRYWYRIRADSLSGWVSAGFVQDAPPGRSGCPTDVPSAPSVATTKDSTAWAMWTPTEEPTPESTDTPAPATVGMAQVVQVVDGDTIKVAIDGQVYTVRYIGIDTPETVHPDKAIEWMGPEASAANEQLVGGQTVRLEKDVSETDRYGRLLRHVWVGEVLISAELVRLGYAQVSTYPPDVKYQAEFLRWQTDAREAGRGLWSAEAPAAAPPPATSTPMPVVVAPTSAPPPRVCCKYCCNSQPCGDSCISWSYTCRKPPGCACSGCR